MNFALEDSRRLAETICEPQPIRCPRVLTGGDGEKKTLRLVAQYADIWNSTVTDADQLIHKIEVLNRHCDALSSPPAERYDATGTPQLSPVSDQLLGSGQFHHGNANAKNITSYGPGSSWSMCGGPISAPLSQSFESLECRLIWDVVKARHPNSRAARPQRASWPAAGPGRLSLAAELGLVPLGLCGVLGHRRLVEPLLDIAAEAVRRTDGRSQGPVPPSLPRRSWRVRCGGSPPSAHRAPDCLRRTTPTGTGGHRRTRGRRVPSSSGTHRATAGRRAYRSWVSLSVLDQPIFGVGLCWFSTPPARAPGFGAAPRSSAMRILVSRIVVDTKGARRASILSVDVGCAHRNW